MFSPIILSQEYVTYGERLHEEISYRFDAGEGPDELRKRQHLEYCHGWKYFLDEFEVLFCEPGERSALQILSRTLGTLPNLSSVEIDCGAYLTGAKEIHHKFGRTYGTEFNRNGALTIPVFFNALIASTKALHRFAISVEDSDFDQREKLRKDVLSVHRVELDYDMRDGGLDQFGLFTAIDRNLAQIQNGPLFSNLKSLELPNVELHISSSNAVPQVASSLQSILLASQTTLQRLHIGRIVQDSQFDQRFDAANAIPRSVAFPQLQFLALQACDIDMSLLRDLIVGCAGTLRHVLLDQIQLFNGSWQAFLKTVSQQDLSELQHFEIKPLDHEDSASDFPRACDIARHLKRT